MMLLQIGSWLSGIFTALANNWVTILVTFIATAASGVYGIRRQTSVKDNKILQAKNDVLDVFEEDIINEKEISIDKMQNIINAVERKHSVNISNRYTRVGLLEDLQLRFEETRYLDPEQKRVYAEKIESSIEELREDEQTLDQVSEFESEFEDIRENIDSGNIDEAKRQLESVENEVVRLETEQSEIPDSVDMLGPEETVGFAVGLIAIGIFWYFVISIFLPNLFDSLPDLQPLLIFGIMLVLVLMSVRGVLRL